MLFSYYQHVQKTHIYSKIITFRPNQLPNETFPFLSNPVPYREYLELLISAFLVNLTPPNQQFSSVELLLESVVSNS